MADIENAIRDIDSLIRAEVVNFLEYAGSFRETTVRIIRDYDIITLWLSGKLKNINLDLDEEIDFGIESSEDESVLI